MRFHSCVILVITIVNALSAEPRVNLPHGTIEGTFKKSYGGKTYTAFEGIPYAKPPIGDLRFEEPQPPDAWEGIKITNTTYKCACYLPFPVIRGVRGTEDCLYLYVHVPKEEINENDNLDVVVHIHGGVFMMGSPKDLAGPDYIMDRNVIYVTFNYRLGILGFLSTEDEVVPGNNGLKDQNMALKWIKANIKLFGGNPDSITLTGHSAGGASVHYHYLSPLSKGLFHRGISHSGTATAMWALTEKPLEKAKFVASKLQCDSTSTKEMVQCMKKLPMTTLIKGILDLFVFAETVPYAPFGPVIETGTNPFLPEHPYKILKDGNVYDVPWITSSTKDEGLIPLGFYVMGGKLPEIAQNWDRLGPYMLDIQDTVEESLQSKVSNDVLKFYLQGKSINMDSLDDLLKVYNDRIYLNNAELAIREHSKATKSPVYYYFFTFVPKHAFQFGSMKKGAFHGVDTKIIYTMMINETPLEEEEATMMNEMVDFVVEYASTGVPSVNGIKWNPIDPSKNDLDMLIIASPQDVHMESKKELSPTSFWDSLPIQENKKLFV